MALDTSIYGNLQPIAPQINPLAQMAQVAQLQAAQYGIGKAQRDEERQNRLYGVMQSAEFQQGDAATRQRLAYGAGDVDAAAKIATSAAAVNKDTREAEKSQIQAAKEHFNVVGQIIGSAKDQPSYERAISMLTERGIKVPNAPPQYDPNVVQQFAEATRTEQERVLAQIQQGTQAETGRSHRANEAIAAGNLGVAQGNAAETARHHGATEELQRQATASGRAPSGYRFGADGVTLEFIPGGPNDPNAKGGAKMTEDQGKATGWLVQAENAFKNMQAAGFTPEGKVKSAAKPGFNDALEKVPYVGGVANAFRTKDRQKFIQASESLSESLLRAATGAGVNKDEAAQKVRELTPLWLEDDETTKQKMDAIPLYIESLKVRAGPGAAKAGEIAGAAPAKTAAAAAPKAGAQRTVVKTGTKPNGQRVTVYSDGSVDVN